MIQMFITSSDFLFSLFFCHHHSRPAQTALLPIPLFSDWRVRKIRIEQHSM